MKDDTLNDLQCFEVDWMEIKILHGDCIEVMRGMSDNSVDSIVTDPPAGISFMGKNWDKDKGGRLHWISWMAEVASECLRVIKPGGHALVWAIPRTSHWTGMAWDDAGWLPRDKIYHCFGSGFPKSLSVSKEIDRIAGAEREVIGKGKSGSPNSHNNYNIKTDVDNGGYEFGGEYTYTAPATPEAKRWDGWGTAMKPAIEEWWLFRKPFKGTVAENVLEWGTGGINIDGCRVGWNPDDRIAYEKKARSFTSHSRWKR
jgi:site-specific DNA-methyltransferase (adenine-specific)